MIKKLLLLLIPLVLTFVVYMPVFSGGFVWDDSDFILNWPAIRTMDHIPELLAGALPQNHFAAGYRPLRNIVMMVDFQLFQEHPMPYHVQGVIFHLINTALIFFIAWTLTKRDSVALLTATFFGVHPGLIEPVGFITSSFDTLGLCFAFGSYLLFLKFLNDRDTHWKLALSMVLALCAFFTYELTYILPLIFTFTMVYLFHREKIIQTLGPSFGLVFITFLTRVYLISGKSTRGIPYASLGLNFIAFAKFFWHYMLLIFAPFHMSIIHEFGKGFSSISIYPAAFTGIQVTNHDTLLGFASFLILVGVAWWLKEKQPIITFGIVWFFLGLLPVSNIIPTGAVFAERYMYFASFGIILALCYGLYIIMNHKPVRAHQPGIWFLIIAVICVFGIQTATRLSIWQSDEVFWESAMKEHPSVAKIYSILGISYIKSGRLDDALVQFLKADELSPNDGNNFYNVSQVYMVKQQWNLALTNAKKAVELDPKNTMYIGYLAKLYEKSGNSTESAKIIQNSPVISGNDEVQWMLLGNTRLEKRDLSGAEEAFRKVISTNPDNAEALVNLGGLLVQGQKYEEGAQYLEKAIKQSPDSVNAFFNVAIAYRQMHQYDKAREAANKALSLAPKDEGILQLVADLKNLK